ncbi:MAG TPA: PhzF family phenazine biosynthesis isomerase [Acidimicrobiia bacterium]|jgi:PhzF family phenazine biosynthesis protein|nr:PhzF family phenazine biosynthesis isomerase [Acidimicrobiia bacterium]
MRLFQVDAFADQAFGGNPAAVCLVEGDVDSDWMQSVAREMNLSETAFLSPVEDGVYGLRWFTPAVEVDLCGHATLASAHILWEEKIEGPEPLSFSTRSGLLTAVPVGDGLIQLDFPADPPDVSYGGGPFSEGVAAALGAPIVGVHRGRFDLLVEVDDAEVVRRLTPDLRALAGFDARGVIVTAAGDGLDGADFVSRCFYPASGIDEDPVTGSAHCTLASFWCTRLGRPSLVGWQASPRGGRVGVELAGDRVLLTGRAVTVLRGELV